jgi:Right handed beta helix region
MFVHRIQTSKHEGLAMALGLAALAALSWGNVQNPQTPSAKTTAEYYASPEGKGKKCSQNDPCSLTVALSDRNKLLRPGDTLWLRGGTYSGTFTSYLQGTPSSPVIVRQMPGERAIIDGGNSQGKAIFTVSGNYTWFWGFEVMSSDPKRLSASDSSQPPDISRGEGVLFDQAAGHGVGTKLINLLIHDTRQGVSVWKEAEDSEIYGCIIYNNGWDGPRGDRGHGHGIYVQNQIGTKRIVDNIIFHQFSHGIHAYGSSSAYLDNLYFQGNILFESGAPSVFGLERNVLVGGGSAAQNITFVQNHTYGTVTKLGYGAPVSGLTMTDNYLATNSNTLELRATDVTMNGNTYIGGQTNNIRGFRESTYPNNEYVTRRPKGVYILVRPNYYEPGRANIAIYNWELKNSVAVDLSGVLKGGDSFEIRDVENYFGSPVATGIYSGVPVTINMGTLNTTMQPIGLRNNIAHTGVEFGAFVVISGSKSSLLNSQFIRKQEGVIQFNGR